jgi:type III pantothenate kinase
VKLLLDLGNSFLKWAVWSGGAFQHLGTEAHRGRLPAEVLAPMLALGLSPTEIRIANVAGQALGQALEAILIARFGLRPRFALSTLKGAGVLSGYRDPAQLGVDRWLALCAAHANASGHACCVVDAGTATTIDVVMANGEHRGGLILPGQGLMQAALRRGTGDLDRLADQAGFGAVGQPGSMETDVLGTDTATAIRLGALRATVCLVDACMKGLLREAVDARLILTGGDAPALMPRVRAPAEYRPALVLEGLALDPPCFAQAGQP